MYVNEVEWDNVVIYVDYIENWIRGINLDDYEKALSSWKNKFLKEYPAAVWYRFSSSHA